MYKMFIKYGIDIRKEPILVYPTLHYQNGGVEINKTCHTNVPNLLVAGDASVAEGEQVNNFCLRKRRAKLKYQARRKPPAAFTEQTA